MAVVLNGKVGYFCVASYCVGSMKKGECIIFCSAEHDDVMISAFEFLS